jgi:hypothetical protein
MMLWGAIASFVMAGLLSVLVGLGFWHARRTSPAHLSAGVSPATPRIARLA